MRHASSLFLSFALFFGLGLPGVALAGEPGVELMQQVDAQMRAINEELSVQMDLASASGVTESRRFRMWVSPGDESRTLIRFEAPANIAGTALLTIGRKNGKQDNWLYVPALDQVRRIAAADRTEAFVQSDFAIEDLGVTMDAEARKYTVLGESACGQRQCVQVEDRPATEAAAKLSGYGRVVLHVDRELKVVHRVDFYDRSNGLLKVLRADGLVQAGTAWRFNRATLTNVRTGSSTVMTVLGRSVVKKMDSSIFSPSTLGAW